MAVALLFSQHSSNPLEDRSSDLRNQAFHQVYAEHFGGGTGTTAGSDDPLALTSQMTDYWRHIAQVKPTAAGALDGNYGERNVMGYSDDELRLGDGDDEEPPPPQRQEGDEDEGEGTECSEDAGGADDDGDDEQDDHNGDDSDHDNDDDDDYVSGSDEEENTILLRSPEERQEILAEIEDLETAVPALKEDYKLVDRLGTGTFSSVYKAIDLHYHTKWDNSIWHGHHPPSSSAYYQTEPRPRNTKVYVAIKRIYVTSSPDRIRNEIAIMRDVRSCRHTAQLITAFRKHDQVVAVMPYQRNDDFREYFKVLPLAGIKCYLRCILRALRDIHAREIIHRDVKPANFLYDARTGIGTLCDFGLACRVEPGPSHNKCLHTAPSPEHPHGKLRVDNDPVRFDVRAVYKAARSKSDTPSERVGYPDPEKDKRPQSKTNRAGTRGFRAPEVLFKCGDQSGAIDVWSVGVILLSFLTGKFPVFQSNDDLEALMEIGAVAGRGKMERVALLHGKTISTNVPSIGDEMTWTQFVMKNNPDLFDFAKFSETRERDTRFYPYSSQPPPQPAPPPPAAPANEPPARKHRSPPPLSSTSTSSSSPNSRSSLLDDEEGERTRRERSSPATTPAPPSPSHHSTTTITTQQSYEAQIQSACQLLEGLLDANCVKRFTPRQALYHPFLLDTDGTTGGGEDDDWVPHALFVGSQGSGTGSGSGSAGGVGGGVGGVCKHLHFKDPVTERHFVRVKKMRKVAKKDEETTGECEEEEEVVVVRPLTSGEGIAIGHQPCEFHRDMV